MAKLDNKTQNFGVQLTSKIDKVKVYAAGATVTRVANLQCADRNVPEQAEITGLPLALDDSSVRVRVEGSTAIATDVRIGLAVPPRQETPTPPLEEKLRQGMAEVKRIEDIISLIDNEIEALRQLHVPVRPTGEERKAPPPSPIEARLAIANFKDEQIRARIQERRDTQKNLRKAQEQLENLKHKQALASTAREVKPHELRKTVIVRLSYEGEQIIIEPQLVVEYFVPGARWTPSYVCRLDSANNTAAIAVRAFLCQRTGEDWSGVRLELSTAEPMNWCELPELPSLRLGCAQPVQKKSGWRLPPVGAETLFQDYDRQKQEMLREVQSESILAELFVPEVSHLPELEISAVNEAESLADEFCDLEYESLLIAPDMEDREETMSRAARIPGYRLEMAMPSSAPTVSAKRRVRHHLVEEKSIKEENYQVDFLSYGLMQIGTPDEQGKRGKLSIERQQEVYLEILKRQQVTVTFDVLETVQQAVSNSQNCLYVNLPLGGINVRQVAGSFDYAYRADGRVDVPADGQFHSVALTSQSTDVDVRYVVVPREDTNVFRIAQLKNPLQAPLLAGAADVYVDGEYILSTTIATVPPKGQMELGLGVEQAIKVARNTTYQEVRSSESLVAFNELRHRIQIDIANRLPREARIEVRERIPVPQDGAKVEVEMGEVSPDWEKYEQEERGTPIQGGYRWQINVPGGEQVKLSAQYTIKTFADSELVDGNRRE
ncbi:MULTISPECIES: DUF4139 domain-containing protein [unclassified Coleofasciculus]|uniref:DUF4139 domain-containing protein n=1 Tax=unclassified Coleofasciculus TaxID=2692782 RepID=UPI00187E2D74|nr:MULTISPECIES: DUF4139 domain-containing protein [unclassified Coleofasciculus]MBE9129015.1 mucoidy inhibitor MuiA family protein [Coleofasciculus sp. LEGE 07081]MBE9151566.1 mucoidy inhibitor MuiA family protein [Coleofasciculus sp. LEGE 07092]